MTATAELAEFVSTTDFEDLPDDVVDRSKRALYNVLAVTLAGATAPVGERVAAYVERQFPDDGPSVVVGHGRTSPVGAALANGTFPSVHHYDDTFDSLLVHPSASSFPAAFAAGESVGTDGRRLLTGYVLGIETTYHVGRSLDPGHAEQGWHSTGTMGTFGAAAASASVLGLTTHEVRHTLGIVASGSSALRRNIGTNTNQLHTGHAAQVGLRAALLARDGFTADDRIFDDELSYGSVMTPSTEYDPADVVESLGHDWGTLDIGFKPYPSASISHGALAALLRIVVNEEISGDDVASVRVHLDPSLANVLDSRFPRDGSDAHASIKYCLAIALQDQRVEITDFTDERVEESAVRVQWEKISCDFRSPLGDGFEPKGARVVVYTNDGSEYSAEQRTPPGSPNNPLTDDQLITKFGECASAAGSSIDAERALSIVTRLESRDMYDEFVRMIERFG